MPLALRRLKYFTAPGKLESGVLQSRNHLNGSLFVSVSTTFDTEYLIAAVGVVANSGRIQRGIGLISIMRDLFVMRFIAVFFS